MTKLLSITSPVGAVKGFCIFIVVGMTQSIEKGEPQGPGLVAVASLASMPLECDHWISALVSHT